MIWPCVVYLVVGWPLCWLALRRAGLWGRVETIVVSGVFAAGWPLAWLIEWMIRHDKRGAVLIGCLFGVLAATPWAIGSAALLFGLLRR